MLAIFIIVDENGCKTNSVFYFKGTLKSAAETTIVLSEPRHKNPHCQDMADISETQRKFRLQINNTRNPARQQELKQQRNMILHAQRRRARDNASVRLDNLASEVERLHDGEKCFERFGR